MNVSKAWIFDIDVLYHLIARKTKRVLLTKMRLLGMG